MKTVALYKTASGTFWLNPPVTPAGETKGTFLHTRCEDEFGYRTFSSTRRRTTKKETCVQYFFIPQEGKEKDRDYQMAVEREFKRGETFFTRREGFLFGAIHELTKLGEIVAIIS